MKKHFKWFISLLAFELWLAYAIPSRALSEWPELGKLVFGMAEYFPVIRNFDRVSVAPEALSLYFIVTIMLFIPKSAFFYLWLNSNTRENYQHLVVSPLTVDRPKKFSSFIFAPLKRPQDDEVTERSTSSRVWWSLGIVFIALLVLLNMCTFGDEIVRHPENSLDSLSAKYRAIAHGGWILWLIWSVAQMSLYSFVMGIFFCLVRDCLVLIRADRFAS